MIIEGRNIFLPFFLIQNTNKLQKKIKQKKKLSYLKKKCYFAHQKK